MKLAMDKRMVDKFGRMRVDVSNISKAAVNPYYGHEIPNAEALGLDLQRVYYLLRDPEELRKAADTFNLLPLLSKHVPVTAEKPSQELVVGSTGTDATFDEPYLRNSLVITERDAVLGVDTGAKIELSSAYSYEADMTPGSYGGVKYDGVMRNIVGNHVALVTEGRAGPDVVVGDSKLLEKPKMKLPPKGVALLGALLGYSATVIAQDAQIGNLHAIVGSGKDLKTAKDRAAVVKAFTKAAEGKLAQDANLDGLAAMVDTVADTDIPAAPNAMDDEPQGGIAEQLAALLTANGIAPEIIAQIQALCSGGAAMDAEPEDKGDKIDKPAMDAAIKSSTEKMRQQMLDVRNAEIEVQPVIGNLAVAMDSAPAVYKLALDHMGVDTADLDASAFKAMFRTAVAVRASNAPASPRIAQDAAMSGAVAFNKMFNKKGGV